MIEIYHRPLRNENLTYSHKSLSQNDLLKKRCKIWYKVARVTCGVLPKKMRLNDSLFKLRPWLPYSMGKIRRTGFFPRSPRGTQIKGAIPHRNKKSPLTGAYFEPFIFSKNPIFFQNYDGATASGRAIPHTRYLALSLAQKKPFHVFPSHKVSQSGQ